MKKLAQRLVPLFAPVSSRTAPSRAAGGSQRLGRRSSLRGAFLALAFAFGAPFLSACGDSVDDAIRSVQLDKQKVRSAAKLVADADPASCHLTTKHFLQKYHHGRVSDCEKESRKAGADKWRIERVVIKGKTATVTVAASGSPLELEFVELGSDWKLDDVVAPEPTDAEEKPTQRNQGRSRVAAW